MSTVYPAKLAYRGVLIERPCAHCDTVDLHFEGRCSTSSNGPCTVCGLPYRSGDGGGWPTHPVDVHGEYRSSLPMHDFEPGYYIPADFESDVPVAFDAIISTVLEIGLPEMFTSDLFRDYQLLSSQGLWRTAPAPRRFIFAVRSTGTDIILPHAGLMTEPRLRANERFFAWDETYLPGLGLCEATEENALELLRIWHAKDMREAEASLLSWTEVTA